MKTLHNVEESTCCGNKGCCEENNINVGSQSYDENTVREMAYFRWLAATGGNPVDENQAKDFWLQAEQEVVGGNTSE